MRSDLPRVMNVSVPPPRAASFFVKRNKERSKAALGHPWPRDIRTSLFIKMLNPATCRLRRSTARCT